MDFDTARAAKFEKGRKEHGAGKPFDAAHIDARREMRDECLDLFNYASLLEDEALKARIQLWCRDIWTELGEMGAGTGSQTAQDAL